MTEKNGSIKPNKLDECTEFEHLAMLAIAGESIDWDRLFSILDSNECLSQKFNPEDPILWWGDTLWNIAFLIFSPRDVTKYLKKIRESLPDISDEDVKSFVIIDSVRLIIDFILTGNFPTPKELDKYAGMILTIPEKAERAKLTPIQLSLIAIGFYKSGDDTYNQVLAVASQITRSIPERFDRIGLWNGISAVDSIIKDLSKKTK